MHILNRNNKNENDNTNIKRIITSIIYILYIVMIPLIIFDVIFMVKTIKNPDQTPEIFGIKIFTIVSDSMKPIISKNDIAIIQNSDKYEINDIITYKNDTDTITHRITNIEEDELGNIIYITKGDNNEVSDNNKIYLEQIEGKYIGKIPKIGKIFNFLKNKFIFEIIISIIIIYLYIERKKLNKKMYRKVKRKKFENKKRLQLM